jgi:hypothetical protein
LPNRSAKERTGSFYQIDHSKTSNCRARIKPSKREPNRKQGSQRIATRFGGGCNYLLIPTPSRNGIRREVIALGERRLRKPAVENPHHFHSIVHEVHLSFPGVLRIHHGVLTQSPLASESATQGVRISK